MTVLTILPEVAAEGAKKLFALGGCLGCKANSPSRDGGRSLLHCSLGRRAEGRG